MEASTLGLCFTIDTMEACNFYRTTLGYALACRTATSAAS
jgi:hypothetical protein